MSGYGVTRILDSLPQVRHLYIRNIGIHVTDWSEMWIRLVEHANLEGLDVSRNNLGEEECQSLVDMCAMALEVSHLLHRFMTYHALQNGFDFTQ